MLPAKPAAIRKKNRMSGPPGPILLPPARGRRSEMDGRGVPVVFAAKENFGAELVGFGFREVLGPRDAGGGVGAGTFGIELSVESSLFGFGLAPVAPTGGRDVVAHPAVEIDHARIVTPRPAERDVFHAGLGGEAAVLEDVALRTVGENAALGRDVAGADRADLAMVEYGSGVTEDEVDGA